MKAILVDEKITCQVGDVYNPEFYPKKNGTYIVDDGTMYYFVMIDFNIELLINTITANPLPRRCVVEQVDKIGQRDVDLLQKQLSELKKGIKDLRDDLDEGISNRFESLDNQVNNVIEKQVLLGQGKDSSSNIDIKDLTKLIAVAQKPELIDKKVG